MVQQIAKELPLVWKRIRSFFYQSLASTSEQGHKQILLDSEGCHKIQELGQPEEQRHKQILLDSEGCQKIQELGQPEPEPDLEESPKWRGAWGWRCLGLLLQFVLLMTIIIGLLSTESWLRGSTFQRRNGVSELSNHHVSTLQELESKLPEFEMMSAFTSVANQAAKPLEPAQSSPLEDHEPALKIPLQRHMQPMMLGGGVSIQQTSAYWGIVNVGTPPVAFKLVFDTGSGHLLLPSSYCHSVTCRAHRRYRRSKSTTARDINYDGTPIQPDQPRDQITVTFGTGEVTGVFVEDKLCLDSQHVDANLMTHCIAMRMVAATYMSEDPFGGFSFDGVMGLGLSALSQTPEFNLLHVISTLTKDNSGEVKPIFSIFLADDEHIPSAKVSELGIGGWSDEHMLTSLSWSNVYEPELGHWLLEVKSLRIGDEVIDFCNTGCKAIVDSGTSLLAVPSLAFPVIYRGLKHPAALAGHCQGPGPLLHLDLDNFTLTFEPKDIAKLQEKPIYQDPFDAQTTFGNSTHKRSVRYDMHCKPMLMSLDLPEPLGPKLFVLGESVLRKYYTVYDAKEKRIGFAMARQRRSKSVSPRQVWPQWDQAMSEPKRISIFDSFRARRSR